MDDDKASAPSMWIDTHVNDHNRLVSTPTTSTPSKANNNHFHLGTTTTTVAQRTNAHQNVSLLAKSNNLTSATLKTSPLANGLQRANSACPVSSPQLEPLAAKNTTTVAETLPQRNDTDNSCSNASAVSTVASVAAARVSVAVECSVETATKAIGAHLGCGGGDQCDNSKGVEALGVLLQYLVFRMDAFGNAHWQKSCHTSNRMLEKTTNQLCAVQTERNNIEQQLLHKEQRFDAELRNAKTIELELRQRIGELTATENELREKVHASDAEFGERLSAAAQRERDLNERMLALQRQQVAAAKEAELLELQWQEKWTLCQDELAVMRARCVADSEQQQQQQQSQNNGGGNGGKPQRMLQDEVESLRCVLDLKQTEISELRKQKHELEADAEALSALKLRVHTLESRLEDVQQQLQLKCAEEKDLRFRMKHVEQCYGHEINNRKSVTLHNEQLQFKLMQNSEKFSVTLTELSRHYHDHADYLNAAKASMYGQENSSASDLNTTSNTSIANKSFGNNVSTSSAIGSVDTDADASGGRAITVSPPSTPVVKGVVEKSESVSWVLEINDDESAEALASRIVRRAGSFRSNVADKWSPQMTSTAAAAKKRPSFGNNGANPLSQSASATSILRQYSEGSSPVFTRHKVMRSINTTPPPVANAALGAGRRRSKSVSTASSSSSSSSSSTASSAASGRTIKPLEDWAELPIRASSPDPKKQRSNCQTVVDDVSAVAPPIQKLENVVAIASPKILRPRSSSLCTTATSGNVSSSSAASFRRTNSSTATTRRGSASVAVAAVSIQDSPKFQLIKESAGEAMVSGTNSEDDDEDDDCCDDHDDDNDEENEDVDDYPLVDLMTGSSDESSMSVSSDGRGNHHDSDVIMLETNRSQDDTF